MSVSNFNCKGLKWKAFLGVLFTSLLSSTAQAQEDKSAIVDYGEHHPLVFISGILAVVGIAVVVVYFVFKRTSKEDKPGTQGFSKPTQRTTRHPADRRYISKKSIPR